jgi:IclR family pca regulon transcriptional regulator
MHSARLPRVVQPELQKLAYAIKEASAASVLDGAEVICIAATNAGRVISTRLHPGARVPAYCTSAGRVLVAALPQPKLDEWIARQHLVPMTAHTLTDADRLRSEIARVRAQGYACVDQELELGLRTVAVPLRNYRGETVAALNISVHASRMTMEQLVNASLQPLTHTQAQLRQLL